MNYPDLKRKVIELAARDNFRAIVIEDAASGTQLIQDLRKTLSGKVKGFSAPGNLDKLLRLHTQTPVFEGGWVHVPADAPWLADYINELTSHPASKHDDQVDSTTQALIWIREVDSLASWRKKINY